jgi:hypothetical protein
VHAAEYGQVPGRLRHEHGERGPELSPVVAGDDGLFSGTTATNPRTIHVEQSTHDTRRRRICI